ncbi:Translin family protein [uncultured archaeon]|nr:Translin family protein [uncultured archaeon]
MFLYPAPRATTYFSLPTLARGEKNNLGKPRRGDSNYVATFINDDESKDSMINKKAFQEMREQMEKFDSLREQLIIQSRTVLKSSKQAIYAAHRGDMKEADKLLEEAKSTIKKNDVLVKKDVHLANVGAYSEGLEEYTEASCYVHYLKTGQIPTPKELGVDADTYLPALSDVIGELVRKAINSAIQGDYDKALAIKFIAGELYEELMLFDWRNSPARKKFDAIKYGLEKLEDLALKIKFKK